MLSSKKRLRDGINEIRGNMEDKVARIRKLLNEGKRTREIARELQVSLRDIQKVRKAEDIDFDELERLKKKVQRHERKKQRYERLKGELERELSQIEREISDKEKSLALWDKEIEVEKGKRNILKVKEWGKPLHLPQRSIRD